MKVFTKIILALCIITIQTQAVKAQCAFNNVFLGNLTPPSAGTTVSETCMYAGEYVTVNVVAGQTYIFSACNNSIFDDLTMTLYNAAGTVVLGYGDDDCGSHPEIVWTATYTGVVNVLIDYYPCSNDALCYQLDVTWVGPCTADAGTYTMTVNGSPLTVGTPAYLCFGAGNCINVVSNDNYVLPASSCPGGTAELMYAIYTGAPTTSDPDTDPNWTGYYWTGDDFSDCNNGSSVFNTVPALSGFTAYWMVPITADQGDNDDAFCPGLGHDLNGDGCFDLGTPIEMHYLNLINIAGTMNTCTGVATITVTGGLPQDNGSTYTITNTGPGTLSVTPITHNGSVTVSGLTNGQTVALTITDGSGCSRNVTYGPVTVNTPANAGTNGSITLCSNGSSVNLFSSLGGSPSTSGSWTGPSALTGGSLGTYNPVTMTPGVYTYTVLGTSPCPNATATVTVTETPAPSATIAYASPFCSSAGVQNVTQTGTAGGTYSATPGGLALNASNGQITPGSSTPGTYTVTYTIAAAGGCPTFTTTASVTITTAPAASISYASPVCSSAGVQNVTQTGTTGGTYSATPAGLSLNTTTGQITPGSSTAGTYTVTYTIAAAGGCPVFTTTANITITAAPNATISYASPFCSSAGVQNVTQTGTAGGTYSATPGGLALNASNGQITPGSSTPGTYTVTYSIAAAGGCAAFSTTASVTITTAPTAAISYAGPFCSSAGVQNVTQTGTAGGTYSATPAGLSLNTTSGQITPGSSTPGTYTVTYTIPAAGGCAIFTTTASVTITAAPSATIAYASPFCSSAGVQNVTQTGTTGGTYSATPAGLSLNAANGQITPGSSTAGTYTVTYTIAAAGGCAMFTTTASVTITTAPAAAISYSGSPYCVTAGVQNVTQTGTTGGTYSATPAGLSLNTTSGQITPSTSTAGTYTITYTIPAAGGCATFTTTAMVTINALDNAAFTYSSATYCQTGTDPSASITGLAGGTFSSTPGIVLNSSTGLIDLSASTLGTYTITYTTNGPCPNTSTVNVTITSAPSANFSYTGAPFCQSGTDPLPTFAPGASAGVFSSTGGLVFVNVNTGEIDLSASTPGTYTVTNTIAASGGCASATATTSITIGAAPNATIAYASPFCSSAAAQNVTQTGTTGGTYSATPAGLSLNTTTGQITPGTSTAGTYTVTYTIPAAGGCITFTTTASVTITTAPSATIAYSGPFCTSVTAPQAVTQTGTTGGTYSATPAGLTLNTTTGEVTPSTSTPGTYTVTYTIAAAGGCAAFTTTASLTINATPSFSVTGSTNPSGCGLADGTVTLGGLTATTTYTISYDNGSVVNLGAVSTDASGNYVITGLPAGTYGTFTVTNAAGCSLVVAGPAVLTDPSAPTGSVLSSTDPTTCGGTDGSITLTGLNPSTTYNISYNDGSGVVTLTGVTTDASGNYVINGLSAGNYTAFTLQLAGCTGSATGSATLFDPGAPTFTVVAPVNPTACAVSDGSITISGLVPSTNYVITYDNGTGTVSLGTVTTDGSGNYVISGLPADTYTNFTVMESGCTTTDNTVISLTDPGAPVFTVGSPVNPSSCGSLDGSITISGLTPSTNYVITYDNGLGTVSLGTVTTDASGNYVITGLQAGTYTNFTVTGSGCTTTDNSVITLTGPSVPAFTATGTNPTVCNGIDGFITISGLAPSTSYVITYDYGGGTLTVGTVTTDASGNYVITGLVFGTYNNFGVIDVATGCSAFNPIDVVLANPPAPNAPVAGTNGTYCVGEVIPNLTATASAGGTLTWYSDAGLTTVIGTGGTLTPSGTAGTTTYYVTETASGCESPSSSVVIIVSNAPGTAPAVTTGSPYCSDALTAMTATAAGGGTISWYNDTLVAPVATGTSLMPSATPATTVYYVNESVGSCAGPYTIVAVTVIDCDTVQLVIPTGFSPDGDGTNDIWEIPGLIENYPENHVDIFTRWGAKIFDSDGYATPWDGTYKGGNMPLGAYYFVIYFNDGATDPLKGTVTIIR